MGMIDETSKKILVESMRRRVCGILKESSTLTSKQATDKSKFIKESATYEQLLNITLNPKRTEKYLPAYVLEGAVAIIHRACRTGRKIIGPNAITEGALKLERETGKVITESMLDAALTAVTEGCGLEIVGDIIKESRTLMEAINFNAGFMNSLYNALLPATTSGISGAGQINQVASMLAQPSMVASHLPQAQTIINTIVRDPALRDQIIQRMASNPNRAADIFKAGLIDAAANGKISRTTRIPNNIIDRFRSIGTSNLTFDKLFRAVRSSGGGGGGGRGPYIPPNVQRSIENATKGGSPWGKVIAGVGLGAAGLWAWNRYNKNKEAMNQATGYEHP